MNGVGGMHRFYDYIPFVIEIYHQPFDEQIWDDGDFTGEIDDDVGAAVVWLPAEVMVCDVRDALNWIGILLVTTAGHQFDAAW